MRKNILTGMIFLFLIIYNTSSFSQNKVHKNVISSPSIQHENNGDFSNNSLNSNQEKKKAVKYPLTISKKAGEEQVVHDEEYLTKEIARVDNHIKAIDFKIENISSDPSKKSKAEQDGWFTQMNDIKVSLQSKKGKLEKELKRYKN
jgi:hypothetical protein